MFLKYLVYPWAGARARQHGSFVLAFQKGAILALTSYKTKSASQWKSGPISLP